MAKSKKKSGKKKSRDKNDADRLTVDIDIDVYRTIEAARQSFDESRNTVLRRLLRIDADGRHSGIGDATVARRAKSGGADAGGWSKLDRFGRSVFLPDRTRIRAAYAGKAINGEIIGGMWVVAGQAYNSPSAALNANVRTRDGNRVNLNGWRHWEVLVPGLSKWVRLNKFDPEPD